MEKPRAEALLRHYQAMPKGASGLPKRGDLHPRDIKPLLSWIFLVNRATNSELQLSLTGTLVDNHVGRPTKGECFYSFYPKAEKGRLQDHLEEAFSYRSGVSIVRTVTGNLGLRHCNATLFPLEGDSGATDRFVGVVDFDIPPSEKLGPDGLSIAPELRVGQLSLDHLDLGFGIPSPALAAQ